MGGVRPEVEELKGDCEEACVLLPWATFFHEAILFASRAFVDGSSCT